MNNRLISYTLQPVDDGFMARHVSCDTATAFGKTEEDAGNNLISAIHEYLEIYPENAGQIFSTQFKEINTND